MGEPVRIGDLAENLIRLSGFEPGKEIPIEITGLRPGERLNEALVMDGETLLPTEHEKVFKVQSSRFEVQGSRFEVVGREEFQRDLEELRRLVAVRDRDGAVAQLKSMAARY